MDRPLEGKSALVTGGNRGIGAAIARRLAADGAAVTITYASSSAAANDVVASILKDGGIAQALKADAREPGASAGAVRASAEFQDGLDILVSNAGINISKPLDDLSLEDYESVFAINVRASMEVIQAAGQTMSAGGRIICVSATIANDFFAPGLGLYGASKAALNAFVQGWSRDLGPKGITINAIVPGPFDTDMNPDGSELSGWLKQKVSLGRYGQPSECASLAAFLAGPEAAFITGSRIIIDGGLTA
ncbi:MAG: SDR family oxidoreductase [Pseudomonadota bacterium]